MLDFHLSRVVIAEYTYNIWGKFAPKPNSKTGSEVPVLEYTGIQHKQVRWNDFISFLVEQIYLIFIWKNFPLSNNYGENGVLFVLQ